MDGYWIRIMGGPMDGFLFYDGMDPSEDWHLVIVGGCFPDGDYFSNGRRVEWVSK